MRAYKRSQRVGELIQREVAQIISQEMKDPRLGFITVTRVALTDDLKLARIYVSILGEEEEREESLSTLRRARGYVRSLLGRRIRIKSIPDISFEIDDTSDYAASIETLLDQVREAS
jgi:ribosome-binding factor A